RRRNTSFSRDWSSDVCSSDLDHRRRPLLLRWCSHSPKPVTPARPSSAAKTAPPPSSSSSSITRDGLRVSPGLGIGGIGGGGGPRSEGRRIGQELGTSGQHSQR